MFASMLRFFQRNEKQILLQWRSKARAAAPHNSHRSMWIEVPAAAGSVPGIQGSVSSPTPVLLPAPRASDKPSSFSTARSSTRPAVVLFFEGDQICEDAAREDLGPDLLDPESHQRHVQAKLPSCWVAVVMPSRVTAEGFACYDNLLQGTTLSGEPLTYQGQGYKAASHIANILAAAARAPGDQQLGTAEVKDAVQRLDKVEGKEAAPQLGSESSGGGEPGSRGCELLGLPCTLIAFSKSGTVLNQILTEMSEHEAARSTAQQLDACADVAAPGAAGPSAAASGTTGSRCRSRSSASASAAAFLDSIVDVHYLDAGLNCRGVHLTDPAVVAQLAPRHRRLPLALHFHGTPRQWRDRRRPWIEREKELSASLFRGVQVPVTEHMYFEGRAPSLKQHFEIIQAVQLTPGS